MESAHHSARVGGFHQPNTGRQVGRHFCGNQVIFGRLVRVDVEARSFLGNHGDVKRPPARDRLQRNVRELDNTRCVRQSIVLSGRECCEYHEPCQRNENGQSGRSAANGSHIPLDAHRAAKLLGEDASHKLQKRLTRFFENESICRVRPPQLETRGERGNPDLPNRRLRADDEPSFVGILEQDFNFSASGLDFKAMYITRFLKAMAEFFKCGIAAFLKLSFIHDRYRLPRRGHSSKESACQVADQFEMIEAFLMIERMISS